MAGSTCPRRLRGRLWDMEGRTSLCHPRVLHPAGGFPHLLVGGKGCQASSSSWTPVQAKKQMVPTISCCSGPLYIARAHLGMHQPCLSLSNAPSQLGEACPQPVWLCGASSTAAHPVVYLTEFILSVLGRLTVARATTAPSCTGERRFREQLC